MSEWVKEHAWKSTSRTRADAQRIPPTHFRFNNFRNIDQRQPRQLIAICVDPGVLDQFRKEARRRRVGYPYTVFTNLGSRTGD